MENNPIPQQIMGELAKRILSELKPILDDHGKQIEQLHLANLRNSWHRGTSENPDAQSVVEHVKNVLRPVLAGNGQGGEDNLKAHMMGMLMASHERGEDPFEAMRRYAEASGYKVAQDPEHTGVDVDGDEAFPGADKLNEEEEKDQNPAIEEAAVIEEKPKSDEEKKADVMKERGRSIRTSSGPQLKKKLEDYTPQERVMLRKTDPHAYAALFNQK